jgi:hypothetical protein
MAKIQGTKNADLLIGTSGKDKIFGLSGNDILDGLDGDDFIFGGHGNDSIFGRAGNDRIDAGKGNDTITGGLGNDDIDGGKGIDTAVYAGDYTDYVISHSGHQHDGHHHGHHHHGHGHGHGHRHHHNDDLKVTVAGPDGTDKLKNVEWLKFDDGLFDVRNDVVYLADAEVAEIGQKPGTEDVINGGGIPADHYGIVRAEGAGVELGLQIHYRNGPTVTTTDDYADGVLLFTVNDGPQSTSNGSSANVANRAAWSFDYSIVTGLNGETTDLSDFTFKFLVDVDPTTAKNYQVFTMAPGGTGSANVHWTNQFGDAVGDDQGINGVVAQNSRNLAFYDVDHSTPLTQPYDPAFGPGQFDIILSAYDGSHLIASNHIVVDVV